MTSFPTEKSTSQETPACSGCRFRSCCSGGGGGGGGGVAEDGVQLVHDDVPDQANSELPEIPKVVDALTALSAVEDLQTVEVNPVVLCRDGAGEGHGADEESDEQGLDHGESD